VEGWRFVGGCYVGRVCGCMGGCVGVWVGAGAGLLCSKLGGEGLLEGLLCSVC